jgi:hypothetical protein
MKNTNMITLFAALAANSEMASAFVPSNAAFAKTPLHLQDHSSLYATSLGMSHDEAPFFLDFPREEHTKPSVEKNQIKKAAAPKPKAKGGPKHKEGLFSPVVLAAKQLLGEKNLNSIRGKSISMHADVIAAFVDTAESEIGQSVLKNMFLLSDRNRDGQIEEQELVTAFRALGFDWLKEKQVRGIFERADSDSNGFIDINEWIQEAPRTLRTNLIKLAKKNGGDMGLLA